MERARKKYKWVEDGAPAEEKQMLLDPRNIEFADRLEKAYTDYAKKRDKIKSTFIIETTVKSAMCLVLIAAVVVDWDYGYYSFLRWFICGTASYLCYQNDQRNRINWMLYFCVILLLFNPLFKVEFSRLTWQIVDVAVVGIILYSIRSQMQSNQMEDTKKVEQPEKPQQDKPKLDAKAILKGLVLDQALNPKLPEKKDEKEIN